MGKISSSDTAVEAAAGGSPDQRPVLMIGFGRGGSGKSTLLLEMVYRAMNFGRDVLVADFDARSKTIRAAFPSAIVPISEELSDVKDEFSKLLNRISKEKVSGLVDFGGGDRFMLEFGKDLRVDRFCEKRGIDPIAIYVLGPEEEDLNHCLSIYNGGHFNPSRFLIAFNEGAIREGQTVLNAFEETKNSEGIQKMKEAGAKVMLVKRLPCMPLVKKRGMNFYSASTGDCREPLDPVEEFMVEDWLDDLEAKRIKLKITDWLP